MYVRDSCSEGSATGGECEPDLYALIGERESGNSGRLDGSVG